MSAPASTTAGPAIGTAGRRRARVGSASVVVGRLAGWAVVVFATALAFRRSWRELGVPVDSGYAGFSAALLGVIGLAALGLALRPAPQAPRDRVSDLVLGSAGLITAAGLLGLFTVRLGEQYGPLRLDLLAAWVFGISAIVVVLGVRLVVRFWPVWAMSLALLPPVYGTGSALLGGDRIAVGGVLVMLASCAVGIVVRDVVAVAATVLIGVVAVVAVDRWLPLFSYQVVPLVVGVTVVLAARGSSLGRSSSFATAISGAGAWPGRSASAVVRGGGARVARSVDGLEGDARCCRARSVPGVDLGRHLRGERRLGRHGHRQPVRLGMCGAGVVVAVAVALAWIPLPGDNTAEFTTVAGVVAGERVTAPGWNVVDHHEYPWIPDYFGPASSGTRQLLEADEVDLGWDSAGDKRRVAVDVISAASGESIGRYPEFALYRLAEPRFGPASYFDLGNGIVGRMRTVVDDRPALRWTWLSWDWQGAGGAERVTLIASTDHLPTAVFPEPDGSLGTSASTILRQMARGRPVDGGPAVLTDTDLLLTLAHLVVAVRTGAL